MGTTRPDVLLVTDDGELRALVTRLRPRGARLQVLSSKELASTAHVAARQVWIDLDADSGGSLSAATRRVYFHTQPRPDVDRLPVGLFIRKPALSAVVDVLWSAVELEASTPANGAARGGVGLPEEAGPGRRALPGWIAEFHELNLKVLCRKCVTRLGGRLGYGDVSLYLHDMEYGLLTLAGSGHRRAIDLAVARTAVQTHLMAAVVRDGRPLCTDSVSAELERRGIPQRAERGYVDDSSLIAPLQCEGRLWGVLNFSRRVRTGATELGLPLDEIFEFLARALQHACEHERARTEARVDSLTGLFNQRWMLEALEREIRRAQRFGNALAVLVLDLDGLKNANDRRGHVAGDCLLRHVAGRIRGVLRQFDGAARVGGDEFVIMLPATNAAGARHVAQRLLQSIQDDPAYLADEPLPITVSIGVAEWSAGWDARQLIDAADRAMYAAKSQGGNRLVFQSDAGAPVSRFEPALSTDAQPARASRFRRDAVAGPPGRDDTTASPPREDGSSQPTGE